jgi:HK97 family phage portal protein
VQIFGLTITRTKAATPRRGGVLQRLTGFGMTGGATWFPPWFETSPGGWQRNDEPTIQSVLSNPTLYSCVTLIAGDIAKLRPMLVEQDEYLIWKEVTSPAFSPVLETPNRYQDRFDFFEWWMMSKLNFGNTYALKARDARGVVAALYILDPKRVMPLVAPDGSVFYELSPDPLNDVPELGAVVPAREIIHDVCCPLFHPLCGVSPIFAAGFPAMQGLNIRSASDKFFSNGSQPGGVLTAPGAITPATAQRLADYWNKNFSGDNTGKIAVLGDGLKYEPLAMSADAAKLVDQLHMSDEDVAKCYHMPRHKVGVGPDPTHANITALQQQYYTDCLQKHVVKLQTKLTSGLGCDAVVGRTLAVEFDLDDLELMDQAGRIEAGVKAITGGMSPNEARARFYDLGPVDGGDQPYLQRQNWPLNLLGTDSAAAVANANANAAAVVASPPEAAALGPLLGRLEALVQKRIAALTPEVAE